MLDDIIESNQYLASENKRLMEQIRELKKQIQLLQDINYELKQDIRHYKRILYSREYNKTYKKKGDSNE